MTHTLHRKGEEAGLQEDYVMLVLFAKGINEEGAEEKMSGIWDLFSKYQSDLTNFGNLVEGNSLETDIEALKKSSNRMLHVVFKDRETLKACLRDMKERDFGLSVVVSGLYEEVEKICSEVGLSPHTVEHSLGIHGKTGRLPDEKVLEVTTMCGHAMVSPNLVDHMVKKIEGGQMSYEEGAKELCKPCKCGIFNPYRAEKLLRIMTTAD